jgi:hypothetical protein
VEAGKEFSSNVPFNLGFTPDGSADALSLFAGNFIKVFRESFRLVATCDSVDWIDWLA